MGQVSENRWVRDKFQKEKIIGWGVGKKKKSKSKTEIKAKKGKKMKLTFQPPW